MSELNVVYLCTSRHWKNAQMCTDDERCVLCEIAILRTLLAAAENVMGEVRVLLRGEEILTTGDTCRNCSKRILRMLKVGDALTEYNKVKP